MNKSEPPDLSRRLNLLYEEMDKKGWDAAVITNRGNLRFLTDFRLNRSATAILVIPQAGQALFLVARLDLERAKKECPYINTVPFPEDTPSYLDALREILSPAKVKTLAVDSSLLYVQAKFLKDLLPNVELLSIDETLLRMRAIKDKEEIERLRRSAKIADEAMQYVLERAEEGKSELELVGLAKMIIAQKGGEDESFEPFLMSGDRAWLPQRVATEKKLCQGELIVFDMGAVFKGYCSDMTRTFALGDLSKEQKKLFQVALEAHDKAIQAIRPGVEAQYVDRVARSYIEESGYGPYFPHLTGHGLGLEIHELPIIDKGNSTRLEEGMVLTIEPGIYLPGIGAARIEDMVLITREGAELLTHTPRNLI
jgi:Xaa-Pro aminopeptidase